MSPVVELAALLAILAFGGGVAVALAARARHVEDGARAVRAAVEAIPGGALLAFDRRLRHTLAAGSGLAGLGVSAGEIEGRMLHEVFPPDLRTILEPAYRAALEGAVNEIELAVAARDYLVRVGPADGGGVAVAYDVTTRRRREQRLSELASRDPLTGAWNRRRLLEELEWLRGGAALGAPAGSLLLLDLDGFKRVNDTLGHEAGDELLRRVVRAIQGAVRRSDAVARIGGDEFAVLLPGAERVEAEAVVEKVRAAVGAVWPVGLHGGVSAGVTAIAAGRGDTSEVLVEADRRMYVAKRTSQARAAAG